MRYDIIIQDIIQVYCTLVRSVLEYAAPVWAGLPSYSSDLVESVQNEALRIIFPDLTYSQALVRAGLQTLSERRNQICVRFIQDLLYHLFCVLQACFPNEQVSTMDLVFGQVLLVRSQISTDSSVQTGSLLSVRTEKTRLVRYLLYL